MGYLTSQYTSEKGDRARMMDQVETDLDQWEVEGFHLAEMVHGDDEQGCHVLVIAHRMELRPAQEPPAPIDGGEMVMTLRVDDPATPELERLAARFAELNGQGSWIKRLWRRATGEKRDPIEWQIIPGHQGDHTGSDRLHEQQVTGEPTGEFTPGAE